MGLVVDMELKHATIIITTTKPFSFQDVRLILTGSF
jgi:hypothetical protein